MDKDFILEQFVKFINIFVMKIKEGLIYLKSNHKKELLTSKKSCLC